MSKFCTHCGTKIENDAAFCTQCGGKTAPAQPVVAPVVPTVHTDDTVSMWAYFGLILLFSIPFVGFISSIIFAFVPQSKNIKNFARAYLVIIAISLIFAIIIGCIVGALVANVVSALGEGFFENIGSLYEQLQQQADLVSQIQNSGAINGALPLN